MSRQDKPHKLSPLFARRADFHREPIVSDADIKKMGVDLHPLARTFTPLDEKRIEELRQELQAMLARNEAAGWPSWLFVGDQLLDDPCRWRACQELGVDPRKQFKSDHIGEQGALRLYLDRRIARRAEGSYAAALVLVIVLNYARDLDHLRTLLSPNSDKKLRPNIAKLLYKYSGAGARSIGNAIATAAQENLRPFWEVYSQDRTSFYDARMGTTTVTHKSSQQSVKFDQRLFGLEDFINRRRNKFAVDFALFMPDISAEDYVSLGDDRTKAILSDFDKSLDFFVGKKLDTEFICLVLPPRLFTTADFVSTYEPWFKQNGFVTRATACLKFKAGLRTNDVKPSWGFVWILAKKPALRLHAVFTDVLLPPPNIAENRQWDYLFKRLLRAFCRPNGCFYFDAGGLQPDLVRSLIRVGDAEEKKVLVPNTTLTWVRENWRNDR